MSTAHRRILGPIAVLAIAAGLSIGLSGPAAASAPHLYSLSAPASVNGGTSNPVTLTLTDEGSQRIVSADLFLPAWFPVAAYQQMSGLAVAQTVGGAAVASGTAAPNDCTLGGLSGACIQLRKLSLTSSGDTAVITLSLPVPPSCANVPGSWGAVATQSNGLNDKYGQPNPAVTGGVTLDAKNSALATAALDSCHLVFSNVGSAGANASITQSDYDTTGSAVSVTIEDQFNNVMAGDSNPVSVSLANDLAGGTLAGTTTQHASGGVATFTGMSIDQGQDNYHLTAADSADNAGGSSNNFDIAQHTAPCNGSCSITTTGTNGNGVIGATGGSGTLVASVDLQGSTPLTCAGYTSYDPNTYQFLTTTTGLTKTVTITIVNPAGAPPYGGRDSTNGPDGDNDFDDFLATQHLCFESPTPFTPLGGGAMVTTGLLPACPTGVTPTAPCDNRSADALVPNRSNTAPGYNIVLQAIIPASFAGDPRMN
jgi:hypothetical protein